MDGGSWLLIFLFIVLLIFAGYFAACESAFTSVNKIRVKSQADEGNKRAKAALWISNNSDKALTAILIGNNIAHIAAASVATLLVTSLWEEGKLGHISENTATLLCTVVTTVTVFLFSEMIPKSLAGDRSFGISKLNAPSLRVFMKCVAPLVAFFNGISHLVTRLFVKEETPTITEDELYDIIDTIEEEGVIDEEQSDLFKSALDFSGTTVHDIMTVRADIVAIPDTASNEEILSLFKETSHSRVPVYNGDPDHVIGILQIRTFIREYLKDPLLDVHEFLIEPFFVSEGTMVDDLLTSMRSHTCYQALVKDETGHTVGLVTIEDCLEELVGEIWDEDDVVDQHFIKLGGNRFRIDTHMNVGDAFERMGTTCTDAHIASRPILSWIFETLGQVPEEGAEFLYKNMEVTIDQVTDGRVAAVIIHLNEDEDERPDTSESEVRV